MKKSQIIYFILGGIVLLFIFLSIFIFSQNIKKERNERDIIQENKIEQSLIPLDLSLRSCFYDIFSKIIMELGESGGLVDEMRLKPFLTSLGYSQNQIEQIIINIKNAGVYFVSGIEYNPLFGEKADYFNFYNLSRIPIYYRVEFSKGPKYRYLNLEEIKKNIEVLGKELIPKCVKLVEKSYKDFTINPVSFPKVDVLFKEKETIVLIDYMLEITELTIKDSKKKSIQKFSIILDVPLKEMVKYSNEFISYIVNNKEIERAFMNYFSAFKAIDENYFPPTYEVSNQYVTWDKKKLSEKFKEIAMAFFSRIRIVNTKERPYLKSDYWDFEISDFYIPYRLNLYSLYFDPVLKIYPNPNSPIYFPKRTSSVLSFGFISFPLPIRYEYVSSYDYAIPAIFEISDDNSFKNEGFSLKFAILPSICRDMLCYEDGTYTSLENEEIDNKICENGIINISFKLKFEPESELNDNIKVFLDCGFISCEYSLEPKNDNIYSVLLPQCINGTLVIDYQEYAPYINDSFKAVATFIPFENYNLDLGMITLYYPKKIFRNDIDLLKVTINDLNKSNSLDEVLSYAKEIENEKYMVIMINQIKPQYMLILSNMDNSTDSINEFSLIPGIYDVTLLFFKNGTQYILGSKKNGKAITDSYSDSSAFIYASSLTDNLKNLYLNGEFDIIDSIIDDETLVKSFLVPFSVWFSDVEPYTNLSSSFGSFCGSRFLLIFYNPGYLIVPPGFETFYYNNETIRNVTKSIIKDLVYTALEFEDYDFLKAIIYVSRNAKKELLINCSESEVDIDSIKGFKMENVPLSIYRYNLTITPEQLYNSNTIKIILLKNKPMLHIFGNMNLEIPEEKREYIGVHFIR